MLSLGRGADGGRAPCGEGLEPGYWAAWSRPAADPRLNRREVEPRQAHGKERSRLGLELGDEGIEMLGVGSVQCHGIDDAAEDC